jgi:tetratricopeptide (TPR) repeat protein
LGIYFSRIQNWADAEAEFLKAIEIYKTHNKEGPLAKEGLEYYLQLIKCYNRQGLFEKSLQVQQEVEASCDEEITFHWHLSNVAMSFIEADQYDVACGFYERILDRYGDLEKSKHLEKDAFELVCFHFDFIPSSLLFVLTVQCFFLF